MIEHPAFLFSLRYPSSSSESGGESGKANLGAEMRRGDAVGEAEFN